MRRPRCPLCHQPKHGKRRRGRYADSFHNIPVHQLRTAVLDRYRLSPDKRFLDAVSAMDSLLSGQARQQALASPDGDAWRITLRNASVGRLSELPDFDKLHALLGNQASRLLGKYAVPEGTEDRDYATVPMLDFHAGIRLLNRLGVSWQQGRGSVRELRAAPSSSGGS